VIRAGLRVLLLALLSAVAAPVALVVWLVTFGSGAARARTGPFLHRWFSRCVCAILGVRVEATGEPPRGACLVTPNHWGYVDVFVLGSLYRSLFVSRADVARWPVAGAFARAGGTLFLRREVRRDAVRVGADVERHLRLGCRVTVFLEGGAGDGVSVRPFKSALVAAAVAARAPCVPAAISYSLPADPDMDPSRVVAWATGDLLPHVGRLLTTRRIAAKVAFLPPRTGADRKHLARELEADVRDALTSTGRTPDPSACTR
jgi:1-acyl-sn-glycerol-3-phosphate acyltransferase